MPLIWIAITITEIVIRPQTVHAKNGCSTNWGITLFGIEGRKFLNVLQTFLFILLDIH